MGAPFYDIPPSGATFVRFFLRDHGATKSDPCIAFGRMKSGVPSCPMWPDKSGSTLSSEFELRRIPALLLLWHQEWGPRPLKSPQEAKSLGFFRPDLEQTGVFDSTEKTLWVP